MRDWNSAQYLMFENERTQPAIDLINRIYSMDTKSQSTVKEYDEAIKNRRDFGSSDTNELQGTNS